MMFFSFETNRPSSEMQAIRETLDQACFTLRTDFPPDQNLIFLASYSMKKRCMFLKRHTRSLAFAG